MSEAPEPDKSSADAGPPKAALRKPRPLQRRGPVRKVLSVVATLATFVFLIVLATSIAMTGKSLELPQWAARQVEQQLNAQLPETTVTVSNVFFGLKDNMLQPTVDLRDVELQSSKGERLVRLPHLRSKLDLTELLTGKIAVETLEMTGAVLVLERGADGQIAFTFDQELSGIGPDMGAVVRSPEQMLNKITAVFDDPNLRELEEIRADELTVVLNDARTNRQISINQGSLRLINDPTDISFVARFALALDEDNSADLSFTATKPKTRSGARVAAKFTDLNSRDLGQQIAALSWLEALDAPVSGALTAQITETGQLSQIFGTLHMTDGVLRPAEQARPLSFDRAQTYVRYDAETQRMHFDEISVDAAEFRVSGTGHADLLDFRAGFPETLLGQLRFSDVRLDPDGMFETPVTFSEGVLDLRYRPADLRMEIGQLVLSKGESEIVTDGFIAVADDGWVGALDARIDQIEQADLLALWPTTAEERTRDWLTTNIKAGELSNAVASLRFDMDQRLRSAVTFDFLGARVRYLKSLPEIQDGRGYAMIDNNRFFLKLHSGQVIAPGERSLDASGSTLDIPDMAAKPSIGDFRLTINGPLQGALALMDLKPFEFLSQSDLPTDLATGHAEVKATLQVPLERDVLLKDIYFDVSADLRAMSSDKIAEGRVLTSDLMVLRAGSGDLSVSGQAQLDGVPIDVTWRRDIGPGSGDASTVTGTVELTDDSLRSFGVDLPSGSVSGSAQADIEIALEKGATPRLKLTSDLAGVGLQIAALDWSKSPGSSGNLLVEARLGDTPRIDKLSVTAPALSAEGTVDLVPGGGLDKAVFSSLRVEDKLNSQVELVGRGVGALAQMKLTGGTIDIRKFGLTSGRTQAGPPLDIALDQVIVTDSIVLSNFRGQFRNDRGLEGQFKASLNGQGAIEGTVIPTARGPAFKVLSADGGTVLKGSGIFRNARGGQMELVLQPNGKSGQFNGDLKIRNTRVKKAPVLADLLSAISVVGLLEQLTGDGILFSNVDASFLLTPAGVTLRRSSAVGPSMGISIEGIYDTERRRMDLQGVVSPIYAVNGLFGALFSPRKGEGLFGFNYTLKGSADDPKVGVNPLSMLTPGVFRELFRQPPPKLRN